MRAGFERIGVSVTLKRAKRSCLDKKRFPDRNSARDKAARQSNAHPEWPAQHPYRCTLCGGFHLTSQPKL